MKQNIPSINDIKMICTKFIDGDMTVNKMDREGGDSIVFDVHADNKDYIFRVSGVRQNYDVEHAVLQLARENNVKVPIVIAENINLDRFPFTFSLQEKLLGVELERLPLKIWPKTFEEVGLELSKLYKIKIKGFGVVNTNHYRKTGEIIGSSSTWKEAINEICFDSFKQIIEKIEKEKSENFSNSKLTSSQKTKLLEIYNNFDQINSKLDMIADFKESSSMLHGDLHAQHFIVKDDHLNGIIDFNKTVVGDPLFDIAYLSVMPHGELYKHTLKTSNVVMDKDRFVLYRLLIAARKIHTRYVRFDYLHQYPEILDTVISELKKINSTL